RETEVQQWGYSDSWVTVDELPAESQSVIAVVPAGVHDPWIAAVLDALGPNTIVTSADVGLPSKIAGYSRVVSLLPVHGEDDAATILRILQAVSESGACIWVVTRGAVAAQFGDKVSNAWPSAVWGLGRVAALELPGSWGGLVDLPEELNEAALSRLPGVFGTSEDQVAVRSGGVLARRLTHRPLQGSARPWCTSGTALITGGTGGLGSYVARWVVERGAEHVILLSRRGPDASDAHELRAELEAAGAGVTILAGDVADRAVLIEALAAVPDTAPLRTIVHAAGVGNALTPLTELTDDQLAAELKVKTVGALLLDELTADFALDAFVLFSSGAASWGGAGQGGYAAGNATLDGLAQYRRSRGRVATSIAWGTWADAGMVVGDSEHSRYLARLGVHPMRPELGVMALQRALEQYEISMTVADVDWSRLVPAFTVVRPSKLFDLIPEAATPVNEQDTGAAEELSALSAEQRRDRLTELVCDHAAAVLGHGSSRDIVSERSFRDAGFDSLTAVEFRNQVQAVTGLSLPATLVFDYPTPARLIDHLDISLSTGSNAAEDFVRLRNRLRALATDPAARSDVELMVQELRELLSAGVSAADSDLDGATDDQLFSMVAEGSTWMVETPPARDH
ncbi:beta-ketoacyl reductase, partial [Nocardia sp. NPDC088792]|uniref:beta-ketoacyl reductase n=1 Tax=Nocardia sp. NPDC088792 TaxID=3364332 RepID=UPI00380CA4CD